MPDAPRPADALAGAPNHAGLRLDLLRDALEAHFPWDRWEARLRAHPPVVERPRGRPHPTFAYIVYPFDYGFAPGTSSGDGDAVDVCLGTRPDLGLVGALATFDHQKRDAEVKLLWGMTPAEVYTAVGFFHFDRRRFEGVPALRAPMRALWRRAEGV